MRRAASAKAPERLRFWCWSSSWFSARPERACRASALRRKTGAARRGRRAGVRACVSSSAALLSAVRGRDVLPFRRERDDGAALLAEVFPRGVAYVFGRDLLVCVEEPVQGFGRARERDVGGERAGYTVVAVQRHREPVARARARGVELRLVNQLGLVALEGLQNLVADVSDLRGVFDARVDGEQFRVGLVLEVGFEVVNLLLFEYELLVEV